MMKSGFVYDLMLEKHKTGLDHPEQSLRSSFIFKKFKESNLLKDAQKIPLRNCNMNELSLVHKIDYLQSSRNEIENGNQHLSTGDTSVCKQSWEVASFATGGVLNAVEKVVAGTLNNAFCITRPPGHHANSEKGMGFCIFNHVAIAARYAQAKLGIGKILIVDWDVHHGNGTQDIFYDDDSVFFFSTHQAPWYPGTGNPEETGKGRGLGSNLNFPFSSGAGRKEILDYAFFSELTKKMTQFKPELILISAGFDSRIDDPLGQFHLEDQDFFALTKLILNVANDYAGGRVVSVLEGGYNLDGLASASVAHFQAMMEGN